MHTMPWLPGLVGQPDAISVEGVLDVPPCQRTLSSHIEEADFNSLFSDATAMAKARLQAISAHHAHAWLIKCSLHES